ncbi:FixH family protein [Neobacillus sp. CF12]|uniref:FixH family protein n=1 Tax=Neobacillus sp. CF12 TaxID=3055864 RepID=UPI0025A19C97|nr:FixH family protein [Neobacillus sp. CF12]MDM5331390.1 FixH family protein [Neobacillus sp. CF12]
MKKMLFLSLMVLAFLLVSACNNKQHPANDELPEFVEVNLTVTPENGKANEPIVFEAKVTQGDENVEDADEVKFEIWRAKDEEHEKITVEHSEDGIYRLEKTFQQEGTYYIISHVTARDMHNMPKEVFVVGTPSEPEDPSESKDDMNMEGH